MPTPLIPQLQAGSQMNDIQNYVVQLQQYLQYILSKLDSKNIRAEGIEADRIKANSITADRMNVTELSAITANLGTITAGLLQAVTITGSLIQTAVSGTYPRIELSSTANLLTAYSNSGDYVQIKPDALGSTSIVFDNGTIQGSIVIINTGLDNVLRLHSEDKLLLSSANDVQLSPGTGGSGVVEFSDWTKIYNLNTTHTMQQDLDAKANTFSGVSGTVYVSSTLGGAADTAITFSNGIRTS